VLGVLARWHSLSVKLHGWTSRAIPGSPLAHPAI